MYIGVHMNTYSQTLRSSVRIGKSSAFHKSISHSFRLKLSLSSLKTNMNSVELSSSKFLQKSAALISAELCVDVMHVFEYVIEQYLHTMSVDIESFASILWLHYKAYVTRLIKRTS
ncbi:hypothetical protein KP509_02G058200 [Ceratopteris richardii]|uniref:Uncharacterized protein n=1 Tax=Ceratopteris richardii TaxID=49495 RepID=A0A8T2VA66_CERRI|nr:hypothetical protein KP509_02G058200 [Ceratopteris richardii]